MVSISERRTELGRAFKSRAFKVGDSIVGGTWLLQEAVGATQEAFAPHYENVRDRVMERPTMAKVEAKVDRIWKRIRTNKLPLTPIYPDSHHAIDPQPSDRSVESQ